MVPIDEYNKRVMRGAIGAQLNDFVTPSLMELEDGATYMGIASDALRMRRCVKHVVALPWLFCKHICLSIALFIILNFAPQACAFLVSLISA